jgi:hypothetical protein
MIILIFNSELGTIPHNAPLTPTLNFKLTHPKCPNFFRLVSK